MRRALTAAAVVLSLAVLSLPGCTRSGGSGQGPAPGSAGSSTTAAPRRATGTSSPTGEGGTATRTSADRVWSSAPKTAMRSAGTIPRLVAVRAASHPAYDRIVFEFEGETPGYRVEYVDQVTQDGSGDPVPLQGRAFLSVILTPATMHDQQGKVTYRGQETLTPGLPTLGQARLAGDFEGQVSWGLGLADTVGFKVTTFGQPPRIVIDLAA
jgi:hypothetical protein